MAEGSTTGSRTLFTRQSSGLVREVSQANAFMFNTAAFFGSQVTWAPVVYTLPFIPIGVLGLTTLGWAMVVVGIGCVFMALIFASFATVMPRSGGDYVYTSRLIPGIGPLIAFVESFGLVIAALALIAFEVPIVLVGLQTTGRIVGIGTGSSFFNDANSWFADGGVIQGIPGLLGCLIVMAGVFFVTIQPTRSFHRIVTILAILGLTSLPVMFIFGLLGVSPDAYATNLPTYAGVSADQLGQAAATNGVVGSGVDFSLSTFPFAMSAVLVALIGFQYSAFISGEVRGNVTRGVLRTILVALAVGVFLYTIYNDVLSYRFGLDSQLGWGSMYWTADANLPMGQPNVFPLTAAIAAPGLWPVWAYVNLVSTPFPFLLAPVSIILISRIALAWSLDRRVPEWFGEVNEHRHAPLNAILTGLAIALVLVVLENFPLLPADWAPPSGKLNLGATLWFSILAALLTWLMPGINAIVGPFARRSLLANAPWRQWLPVFGVIWVLFAGTIFLIAGIKPMLDAVANSLAPGAQESAFSYFNRSGITFALLTFVVAIVIYLVMSIRNRARGVEEGLIYRELPPD